MLYPYCRITRTQYFKSEVFDPDGAKLTVETEEFAESSDKDEVLKSTSWKVGGQAQASFDNISASLYAEYQRQLSDTSLAASKSATKVKYTFERSVTTSTVVYWLLYDNTLVVCIASPDAVKAGSTNITIPVPDPHNPKPNGTEHFVGTWLDEGSVSCHKSKACRVVEIPIAAARQPSPSPSPSPIKLKEWDCCGGTHGNNCKPPSCVMGNWPYPGMECPPGTTCAPDSETWWHCCPNAKVQNGRCV